MPESNNKMNIFKKAYLQVAGVLLLLFLALLLLWFNNSNSNQAFSAMVAQVRFYGEYRIGNGQWQEIVEGQHIPATKGDVTLQGNFHMLTPDGEYVGIYSGDLPIAFYTNHISLTFYEGEKEPYIIDMENPLYGNSVCGKGWTAHLFTIGREDPIEIVVHNPHNFGNETAIDEMLSNIALWSGIDFERDAMKDGLAQRNTGLLFLIVSVFFLYLTHLGGEDSGFSGIFLLLDRKRQHSQLNNKRKDDDGNSDIGYTQLINEVEQITERCTYQRVQKGHRRC